ncbi:MAG: hypothetical protein HYW70_00850 [Candidatus Nealsonbacteria bacterium]|nr:hypothetical protein [Candidatus Nealsonbacteria bacterium]
MVKNQALFGHYRLKMQELKSAETEDLVRALGQDSYEQLLTANRAGGAGALMETIPNLLKWDNDPLAARYLSIYDVFRYKKGRCGEWAHFALGVLYLFGVRRLEMVHDFTDHVWIKVEGSHYDPTLSGEARYDKTYYARAWKKPYSYIFAIDINGDIRDVTKDYVPLTLRLRLRRLRKLKRP